MGIKYLIAFLVAICLLFNSCKKGCTNPKALNYNASAKEDDASCMFCDSVVFDTYFLQSSAEDQNPSGPYYYQTVLNITLQGNLMQFRGNACKRDISTCGSNSSSAVIYTTLRNITTDTMVVSGNFIMQISGANNGTRQILVNHTVIPPLSSYTLSDATNVDCVFSSFAQVGAYNQSFNFEYR